MESPPDIRSLGEHVRDARRRIRRARPLSFYLLLAMIAFVLVSGVVAPAVDENPRGFFAFLAANFAFFFVVMVFAIRDCSRILRGYVRDSRDIYPTTLGEHTFTAELAERMAPEMEE